MDLSTIVDVESGKNPTIETYRELELAYVYFNDYLFESQLPSCLITLQREKRTLGYHSSGRFVNAEGEQIDELALNPSYFGVRSIKQTLSTLVHEQCHAVMDLLGMSSRRGYHDKRWGTKMKEIGLYPSNTGRYGGKETGQQMSHYIIKGGKFDVACDELLSKEFKLSWFDRFPPCSPMDLDVPLPSSFLVTTVEFKPKKDPKPTFLDDEEDGADGFTLFLGGNDTRINKILGMNDEDNDYDDDQDESNLTGLKYKAPAAEGRDDSNVDLLVSDVLNSGNGKIIEDNDDQIVVEIEDNSISGINTDLLNKPSVESNSNRLKYKCPTCSVQVWGKPKLKLKCGEESCFDALLLAE